MAKTMLLQPLSPHRYYTNEGVRPPITANSNAHMPIMATMSNKNTNIDISSSIVTNNHDEINSPHHPHYRSNTSSITNHLFTGPRWITSAQSAIHRFQLGQFLTQNWAPMKRSRQYDKGLVIVAIMFVKCATSRLQGSIMSQDIIKMRTLFHPSRQ